MKIIIKKDAVTIGTFHQDALEIECEESEKGTVEIFLAQRQTMLDEIQRLHNEKEMLAGKVDALEGESSDPDRLDELAQERAEVLLVAKSTGLKEDSFKGVSNADVKRQVVMKKYPSTKADASDERIDGMFEIVAADVQKVQTNRKANAELGRFTSSVHADGAQPAEGMREDGQPMSYRERRDAALERMNQTGKTDASEDEDGEE